MNTTHPSRQSCRQIAALLFVIGIVAAAACSVGDGAEATDVSTPSDRPVDAEVAPSTSGLEWHVEFRDDEIVELSYRDVAGLQRRVRAQVRLPDAPSSVRPVVVWSHGGSRGVGRVERAGDRWGKAVTESGTAFVAIAHTARDPAQWASLCAAVGAAECGTFNPMFWDRPHDLAVVLDWLETAVVANPELPLDLDRIVYAGHSAGAIAVLTIAGMHWPFASELRPPSDPRPIAFVATSPPGEAARGLTARSFADLDRPLLFLTGAGDSTASTDALDRAATFELLANDLPAAMVWFERAEARHGVFDLNLAPCERAGGRRPPCRTLVRSVADAGIAFIDAATSPSGRVDADEIERAMSAVLPAWAELRMAADG
ncbi:MAG: hypothetical protein AAFP84_17690 [Actinomycetota bacterium]